MSENRFGYLRGNKPRRPEEVPFIAHCQSIWDSWFRNIHRKS